MTNKNNSKEEQNEKDAQALKAVNTQANAGVPPNASDNVVVNNETPLQTAQQAQVDVQAQATVEQNIEGDKKAHEYNENLTLLKRLVGKASPLVEDKEEVEEQEDANGNKVQVPVTKKVTKGYTYYHVNGKPFADWVKETFQGKITVDETNNKIIYNDKE